MLSHLAGVKEKKNLKQKTKKKTCHWDAHNWKRRLGGSNLRRSKFYRQYAQDRLHQIAEVADFCRLWRPNNQSYKHLQYPVNICKFQFWTYCQRDCIKRLPQRNPCSYKRDPCS